MVLTRKSAIDVSAETFFVRTMNWRRFRDNYRRCAPLFLLGLRKQQSPQHCGILTTVAGLVVASAHTHLLETQRVIQPSGGEIRRPDFEKRFVHARVARPVDQVEEHFAREAAVSRAKRSST